jgi:cytoplasmic iron level regulating protein YaaA (DUF328/UPF0246 family)
MNNIELCLQDKISSSNNKLQPTIFRAILNLYNAGIITITAKMVKEECGLIDKTISWNNRLPAICSAMRSTIDCGGIITSQDRDFNEFKVEFLGNPKKKSTTKTKVSKKTVNEKTSIKANSLRDFKNISNKNLSTDQTIYLIACSKSKIKATQLKQKPFDYSNLCFAKELSDYRKNLVKIITDSQTVHLNSKKETIKNILNFNLTETANIVYSKGRFYNANAANSAKWTQKDKSKIYIISALFGIIKADDYIPLYNLAMTDQINDCKNYAQKFWQGKLDNLIENIINEGHTIYNLLGKNYMKCLDKKITNQIITPNIKYSRSDSSEKRGKWLKSNI